MSLLRAIFRNKGTPLSQIQCVSSVLQNSSSWVRLAVKREKGMQLKGVKTFPTGVTIAISGKDACAGNENLEAHAQRYHV